MFFQKVKPPLGMLGGDGMITFGADGEQVVLTDYGGTPVRSQDPDFFPGHLYATTTKNKSKNLSQNNHTVARITIPKNH